MKLGISIALVLLFAVAISPSAAAGPDSYAPTCAVDNNVCACVGGGLWGNTCKNTEGRTCDYTAGPSRDQQTGLFCR